MFVWFGIIAAETINGALREVFLTPAIGDRPARRISFGIAIVLITVIVLSFVRWIGASDLPSLAAIGLLWVVLTLLFEVGIGTTLAGRTWEQIRSDFDPWSGGLMFFGLAYLAVVPTAAVYVIGAFRRQNKEKS